MATANPRIIMTAKTATLRLIVSLLFQQRFRDLRKSSNTQVVLENRTIRSIQHDARDHVSSYAVSARLNNQFECSFSTYYFHLRCGPGMCTSCGEKFSEWGKWVENKRTRGFCHAGSTSLLEAELR